MVLLTLYILKLPVLYSFLQIMIIPFYKFGQIWKNRFNNSKLVCRNLSARTMLIGNKLLYHVPLQVTVWWGAHHLLKPPPFHPKPLRCPTPLPVKNLLCPLNSRIASYNLNLVYSSPQRKRFFYNRQTQQ
jgi:hypothetical protein